MRITYIQSVFTVLDNVTAVNISEADRQRDPKVTEAVGARLALRVLAVVFGDNDGWYIVSSKNTQHRIEYFVLSD